MPIYEYLCQACGKVSETVQKFADAPLTDCELCGEKNALSKLISRSSFQLKGSGWYSTDYKKSSAPKPTDAANTTGSSSENKSGETKAAESQSGESKSADSKASEKVIPPAAAIKTP